MAISNSTSLSMFPFISEESECPWASSGGRCFISSLKNQSSPLINQTMFYFISEGVKCTQASFEKMFCFIAEVSKFVFDRSQRYSGSSLNLLQIYFMFISEQHQIYFVFISEQYRYFYVHLWTADMFYVHRWTTSIRFMFISEQDIFYVHLWTGEMF